MDNFRSKIDELRLEGGSLGLGESSRNVECPWCHHKERGSILTRSEAGLHYKCYHGSCPVGGKSLFISSRGFVRGCEQEKQKKPPKLYDYELTPLTRQQGKYLYEKTGIPPEMVNKYRIMYNPCKGSYAYPIYDRFGRHIGVVDRSYSGRGKKAITYWECDDCTKLFYSQTFQKGPIVVTEDIPSAIRVGRFIRSASFMGTSPTPDMMRELARETAHLVLWLDYDLWTSARTDAIPVQLKKKYGIMFDHFDIIISKDDPKDMKNKDIINKLHEVFGEFI